MPNVSPIAQFLRVNKAIPKHDKFGTHFISPEGLYLGRLTKATVDGYRLFSLDIFGEGMKRIYNKSVAFGQQLAYVKNSSAPLGLSIVPLKTYMRTIFVDFLERYHITKDTEKVLQNKIKLVALDENTGVGIFDSDKPFVSKEYVKKFEKKDLKGHLNEHTIH